MDKIDFAALIKDPEKDQETVENSQNQAKSRALPDQKPTACTKSGNHNKLNNKDNMESARLARLARPKKEGIGINEGNSPTPEGGSARKSRAANLHPIAVCLLFAVAKKIQSEDEEIFHELVKLETMPPLEQVKTWARYAVENGINCHDVIYPFIKSPGKGHDCMSCQHLDMTCTSQPGISRKVFLWKCKKEFQILETSYLRERLLIAPAECADYEHV